MSVDLSGNTNFVCFKSLPVTHVVNGTTVTTQSYIVPRTSLAAIDLTVMNGVLVAGNTISLDLASSSDVSAGNQNKVITADTLKMVIDGFISYIEVDVSSSEAEPVTLG